jgi:capsular polysaccharide biosynthesis protein
MKYRETLSCLARALGAEVLPEQQTDQPVYMSKTLNNTGVRRYIGEERVETYLAERGVRIVHPQLLPFAEQFRTVNQHRNVIGFQGSQMANLVSALEPRNVVFFTDHQVWPGYFVLTRSYGNTATFINVAKDAHKVHTLYNSAMRRVLGKKIQYEGFDKFHQVDHERAIAWLEQSGLV